MATFDVFIRNIPYERTAAEIVHLFQSFLGEGSVVGCEIVCKISPLGQKQSKGFAFAHIADRDSAEKLCEISRQGLLVLSGRLGARRLEVKMKAGKAARGPTHGTFKVEGATVHMLVPTGKNVAERMWASPSGVVELHMCFDSRTVVLLFRESSTGSSNSGAAKGVQRKADFKFRNLKSVERGEGNSVVFESNEPPRLFRTMNGPGGDTSGLSMLEQLLMTMSINDPFVYSKEEADELTWSRAVDFTPYAGAGRCMMYKVSFPQANSMEQIHTQEEIWQKLREFHLTHAPSSQRRLRIEGSLLKEHLAEVIRRQGKQVVQTLVEAPAGVHIPFDVMFQVNKLVHYGYIPEPGLGMRFYSILNNMKHNDALKAVQAMQTRNMAYDAVEALKNASRKTKRWPRQGRLQREFMQVYTLGVTPTAAYCEGPEVLLSNRVTRKFHHLQDHFLSVSFVDEGGEQLGSYALTYAQKLALGVKEINNEVYDRFLSILKEGITLCGRHYDFLGFSNSQLRNTHFWMFAPEGNTDAEKIRRWTGNYDNIKNVGKSAARRGQCYSSSRSTLEVSAYEMEEQQDILRTDPNTGIEYNFSDGIGQMSPLFASQVARAIPSLADDGVVPSAFQVRYAGYKGVVATNVHRPDLWRRYKLLLRKSMRKFESTHT